MKWPKAEVVWVKIIQEPVQALNPSLTQFMSIDIAQDLFLNRWPTSKLVPRISWMKTEVNSCKPQDYWTHYQEPLDLEQKEDINFLFLCFPG